MRAQLKMLLAVPLALATLPVLGEDSETAAEDPWKGKQRSAIIELLGKPQKIKKFGRDGETLIYKVFRVNPADIGRSGLRIVPVPGVGLIGVKAPGSGDDTPMNIGPTEIDGETGHPTGGGLTPTQTYTKSYDPGTGETETSGVVGNTPAGKIKLTFVLDERGRVKEWSSGGKK